MVGPSSPEPQTTGQPLAPVVPERRTPGQLVASVAIVLGLVVLLGGFAAVASIAVRSREQPEAAAPVAPAAPAPTPPSRLPSAATGAEPAPAPNEAAPQAVAPDAEAFRDDARGTAAGLTEPEPPPPSGQHALIPLGFERPTRGGAGAEVTLSLFGDLTCPYTRLALETADRTLARHGNGVRFVFHHLPLRAEASARERARRVALVAVREGPAAAWAALSAESDRSGVPPPAEPTPAERARVDAVLSEDERLAAVLDVRGTPTLFVNGSRLFGQVAPELLDDGIEREQRAVRRLLARGLGAERAYAVRLQSNLLGLDEATSERVCGPSAGCGGG